MPGCKTHLFMCLFHTFTFILNFTCREKGLQEVKMQFCQPVDICRPPWRWGGAWWSCEVQHLVQGVRCSWTIRPDDLECSWDVSNLALFKYNPQWGGDGDNIINDVSRYVEGFTRCPTTRSNSSPPSPNANWSPCAISRTFFVYLNLPSANVALRKLNWCSLRSPWPSKKRLKSRSTRTVSWNWSMILSNMVSRSVESAALDQVSKRTNRLALGRISMTFVFSEGTLTGCAWGAFSDKVKTVFSDLGIWDSD